MYRILVMRKMLQDFVRIPFCYLTHNAVMENFFGHRKTEMYHGETFTSLEEFYQAIDEYIR